MVLKVRIKPKVKLEMIIMSCWNLLATRWNIQWREQSQRKSEFCTGKQLHNIITAIFRFKKTSINSFFTMLKLDPNAMGMCIVALKRSSIENIILKTSD